MWKWMWSTVEGPADHGGQVHHVGRLRIITGDAKYVQGARRVDPAAHSALTDAMSGCLTIYYSMTKYRP